MAFRPCLTTGLVLSTKLSLNIFAFKLRIRICQGTLIIFCYAFHLLRGQLFSQIDIKRFEGRICKEKRRPSDNKLRCWTKKKPPTNRGLFLLYGTEGRNRTGTLEEHRFLRPTCLPIPPLRQSGVHYRVSFSYGQELSQQKRATQFA